MWTQSMAFPARLKAMHMDAWQWTAALTSGRSLENLAVDNRFARDRADTAQFLESIVKVN